VRYFDPLDTDKDVVTLLEGTPILSFLRHTGRKVIRDVYIEKLEELLSFREKYGVSVGGVISNSSARELSKSLWSLLTDERNIEEVGPDSYQNGFKSSSLSRFGAGSVAASATY